MTKLNKIQQEIVDKLKMGCKANLGKGCTVQVLGTKYNKETLDFLYSAGYVKKMGNSIWYA